MKKLINFLFGHTGYTVFPHIYYYQGDPDMGYELCYGYKVFGFQCYDRIAIAHDRQQLNKELRIRNIKL